MEGFVFGGYMDLEKLRQEIDAIDQEILELLNRRASLALSIGAIKRDCGKPVRSPDRERAILDRLRQLSKGPLSERAVVGLFSLIIAETRSLEGAMGEAAPKEKGP